MSYKHVLIFLAGVAVGGSGVFAYERFSKKSESQVEGDSDDSKLDSVCEDCGWSNSDKGWTEADRKRVSEFLQNPQYMEPSDFNFSPSETVETSDLALAKDNSTDHTNTCVSRIEELQKQIQIMREDPDGVHLSVKDPESISPGVVFTRCDTCDSSDDSSKDKADDVEPNVSSIQYVDSIEFVKAVAAGKQMRSFIFDPMQQKLYWNFTDEPLDEYELDVMVGSSVLEDIKNESNETPNRAIKPKYLYDETEDVYTKIETGMVI